MKKPFSIDQMLARIGADNEQDREAARTWMREATNSEKVLVWTAIQAMPDEGVMGIVSRFAQLAFGEVMEETTKANGAKA